ncbi:heme exporter protein CcmD [Pseudaestuariivita sp.]|uniref:heme exporter protein CcmD n=1 Tax=Pseudaestuariivita sp. TaxID=2211669 RepID=UPI0040597E5C
MSWTLNVDLGKYATEVLLSYAGGLALMLALVIVFVRQYRTTARALRAAEACAARSTDG